MISPAELAGRVIQWGPLSGVSPSDPALLAVSEATIGLVASLPISQTDDGELPPRARLAATMLAARLYRRRNSPNGLETFTADGGVAYVARYDSDVSRLLDLDRPQVG